MFTRSHLLALSAPGPSFRRIGHFAALARGAKISFLFLVLLFAAYFHANAQAPVELEWDASSTTNLSGYLVQYGTSSGNYTQSVSVGNTTSTTVPDLAPGSSYYFVVTAYNTSGVPSTPSNELMYTVPASQGPAVSITSPAGGASFTAPAAVTLTAATSDTTGTVTSVSYYNGSTLLGQATSAPYSFTWSGVTAGSYSITAQAVDNQGASAASPAVGITVSAAGVSGSSSTTTGTTATGTTTTGTTTTGTTTTGTSTTTSGSTAAATASAVFVTTDSATQGNWKGVYGADGFNTIDDTVSYPSYATVTSTTAASWTWAASTSDPRALETASSSTGRIAACWYTGASSSFKLFNFGVNLTDGNQHQLALYAVDWDNAGPRNETIQILNASTGSVLDTETVSGFYGGKYLVWKVQGNVKVIVTNNVGGSNGVISGLFFDPVVSTNTTTSGTTGSTTSGSTGSTNTTSGGTTTSGTTGATTSGSTGATTSGSTGTTTSGSTGATTTGTTTSGTTGTTTSGTTGATTSGSTGATTSGTTGTATSGSTGTTTSGTTGATTSGTSGTSSTVAASAVFVTTDGTSQGTWKGQFGADGFKTICDTTNYPSYATVSNTGNSTWTWTSASSDPRALQKAYSSTTRMAACWYTAQSSSYTIDVNLTDGNAHQIALYAVDWDGSGQRSETIQITDATSGNVLSTEPVSSFQAGEYLIWTVQGHVHINIINNDPASNAVLSGLFFDPAGTTQAPTPRVAQFVALDGTTQGNWSASYGSDGYNVISNTYNYPAYATVTPITTSTYTWAQSSTDARALQIVNRVAGCWYSGETAGSSFSVNVNLTDGKTHPVAIYAVDWDGFGPRSETVQITDANTGAVLDTETLSSFQGGEYLVWYLKGNVIIQVTNNKAGSDAVISGLYFGATGDATTTVTGTSGAAQYVGADTDTQGNWRGVYGTDGYNVIGGKSNYPAYASVTPTGASTGIWDAATGDVRAPEFAGTPGRVASCWYTGGGTPFTIDVNLTDGNVHRIALYGVDWDDCGPRAEQIQVLDAVTGAVLDTRTLNSFFAGRYVVWNLQGHVHIQVTNLVPGSNAVLSGLFFGSTGRNLNY